MVISRLPSAGFSITIRIGVTADASAIGRLTTCVGEAGAIVTALDVVDSDPTTVIVDLTCDTADSAHADQVVDALTALDGVDVRKVSDRTFLLHLGGKIEVAPKVALRNRDELSRAYTPGVARVCLAIAENPADARRLTIKRNTVAVVTDGSAVLGLGNLGAVPALPVVSSGSESTICSTRRATRSKRCSVCHPSTGCCTTHSSARCTTSSRAPGDRAVLQS